MPIDRQVQRLLDQYKRFGVPPIPTLTPEEVRQQPTLADAARALLEQQGEEVSTEPVGNVADQSIPGPAGDLPIRIYRPKGSGPFPVLVYFHSGGWVRGNLESADAACRALCNKAQCLVVSVSYRQAPEHRYPAAVDDAYAATQWVFENAASIDGDPQRVAVGGEGAGGNLAAVVCLRARDQGAPLPIYQALIYPVTNDACDTLSYAEQANNPVLSRDTMRWFWQQYLPDAQTGQQPYASPLRAADLSGLPPAVIITAEYDPLRDEGEAYAQRLRDAGVPVVSSRYSDMVHLFFGLVDVLEPARKALQEVAAGLRSAFSRSPELAQSSIIPQGAVVAAEAQTREGVQIGSLGLEQRGIATQGKAQTAGSELVRQKASQGVAQRDSTRREHPQQENPTMTSLTQPPEDRRAPGTPITPANIPADEYDAGHPEMATREESASIIPSDTRVQERAPGIPTDLDEDQGVAATQPGIIPSERTQVIPGGKPGQERAPVIPTDEGLPPKESVVHADKPTEEASAPVPGDVSIVDTPQVPGDTPTIPVQPAASATPARVGQPVVDASGNPIGQVKEVQAEQFVIDRPQLPDLTVPFYAIRATGEQITLAGTTGQIENSDWSQQPNA